jgi:hypothetical protein
VTGILVSKCAVTGCVAALRAGTVRTTTCALAHGLRSLNASLAQWLFAAGLTESSYVAAQGTCLGRKGRIYLTRDDAGQVWVGGETRTHVKGELHSF